MPFRSLSLSRTAGQHPPQEAEGRFSKQASNPSSLRLVHATLHHTMNAQNTAVLLSAVLSSNNPLQLLELSVENKQPALHS